MAALILDGKAAAAAIRGEVTAAAAAFQQRSGAVPGLAVIIAGENPASEVYVSNKHRTCIEAGLRSEVIRLPGNVSEAALLATVDRLNSDPGTHGILVQLPLPPQVASEKVLAAIRPDKDVDGFHPYNAGLLATGRERLVPCTPAGIIRLLDMNGLQVAGRRAVIIGRSNIVGKPMFHLLLARDATVTVCHSRTPDLAGIVREADIVVAAVGRPRFVTAGMIRPGAIVVDVGINRLDGRLVGDVDFEAVRELAGAITPVPGGVGHMTIAVLLRNTLVAAYRHAGLQMEGDAL